MTLHQNCCCKRLRKEKIIFNMRKHFLYYLNPKNTYKAKKPTFRASNHEILVLKVNLIDGKPILP